MSVREESKGSAFTLCTNILLCREVYGQKGGELNYSFLDELLLDPDVSSTCKEVLKTDFNFLKYDLVTDKNLQKTEEVDD